ncbi:MAG TPA: GNAT family N-acetyltransferase, partial [Dehalococcoidia bacterium]
ITGYDAAAPPAYDVQTAYGYGGPLFVGPWDACGKRRALRCVADYLRSTGVVAEFVRCHTHWVDVEALRDAGYATPQVRTDVVYRVGGKSPEDILAEWNRLEGRHLRRARKCGLRDRTGHGGPGVAAFKALYDLTADRVAMDPFYRFDAPYLSAICGQGEGQVQVVLAEAPGEPPPVVAAAILFLGPALAHPHLVGWDAAYSPSRPNDFLYWAMACRAAAAGCRWISWGGGLTNDPADPLLRFKLRFGDGAVPVHIGCRVIDDGRYRALCREWARRNPGRAGTVDRFLRYRF